MAKFFHLTQSSEILRVRRLGKSSAHPLLVLIALTQPEPRFSRFAVIAGKSVGGAVQRNRAKRRIKSIVQTLSVQLKPGCDVVIIARKGVDKAPYSLLLQAFLDSCTKIRLLTE